MSGSNASGQQQAASSAATASSSVGRASTDEDYTAQDQVIVYSHEGDGENTEHLNSMDLHDIKTELERDAEAEKAETPKSAADVSTSPSFNSDGSGAVATSSSGLPQASIRPVIHHPTAMVYANGGAVPFMIPPFAAAAAGGSPLYPVMRPVKVESDWKTSAAGTGQLSIPTYSYPAGFLPVDQNGIRPTAYPFMAIPSQYVTPYQAQFTAVGQSVSPNATVQPNSGGMISQPVKEKKPHIKKPLNAFMLFMKQKRADVIKECTLKESAAINQILGKMWHALDRSEQAKYYEMAREERAKHMQMYPGWSARDNYAIHKKRRKRKVKQVESKGEEGSEEPGKGMSDGDAGCLTTKDVSPLTCVPTTTKSTLSPLKTTPTSNQHADDDEVDLNNRKCRARFGLDQQHMWCSPCRRKKKCIRFSVDGEEEHGLKDVTSDVGDDDVMVTPAGLTETTLVLSDPSTTESQKQLPHLLRHDVTLQTIPT